MVLLGGSEGRRRDDLGDDRAHETAPSVELSGRDLGGFLAILRKVGMLSPGS